MVDFLPHTNAGLNLVATLLLLLGWILIRRGHEVAHRRVMLVCFAVSVLFLAGYLVYHWELHRITGQRGRPFPSDVAGLIRGFYYTVLVSHVILAATVPFLAITTIVYGLRDKRVVHRRWARVTWPVWMYVSVTGVVIYVMLYHLYPV